MIKQIKCVLAAIVTTSALVAYVSGAGAMPAASNLALTQPGDVSSAEHVEYHPGWNVAGPHHHSHHGGSHHGHPAIDHGKYTGHHGHRHHGGESDHR